MYEINKRAYSWLPPEEIEVAAMTQVQQIASMPIVFKHVAVMPDCHLGKGATVGSCIPTNEALIPAAVGVDIGCFRGDTQVPLLDGTQRTLKELADDGGEFWVYSVDSKTLKVVPGKARSLKTRVDAPLVKVTVSGGDEVICTPDHEFMLSDGSYKAAEDLKFNESLMPLYRLWQTRDGYEKVSNGKGKSQLTHRMVYTAINGTPGSRVVHHVNHNHFDNSPENLVAMSAGEHSTHHRRVGHSFDNADPALQQARLAGIKRANIDPKRQEQMVEVGTRNITTYMKERYSHFKEAVAGNGARGAKYLARFNTSPRECSDCGEVAKNPATLRWHKNKVHAYNHKVVSVEPLEERSDVYCLQVEEHHNFALSAGVFVHNCGMIAVQTEYTKNDMPKNLAPLRENIERRIPLSTGGRNEDLTSTARYYINLLELIAKDRIKFYDQRNGNWRRQLGSLGSGNHFIEIVLDQDDVVWAFLHSGSRGIGNRVAQYHIDAAQEWCKKEGISLPNRDLAYLSEGTVEFAAYVKDLEWCQQYALHNRDEMMNRVLIALADFLHKDHRRNIKRVQTISCHHNYTVQEEHFGKPDVWVSRKGAINAAEGVYGLIPGSMGTASYVVRGKGNEMAFRTAPHGAGRRFSRNEARKRFTMDDFDRTMKGVEVKRDKDFLDELPGAYKNVDRVMKQSEELVEVVNVFRQIVNVKGAGLARRKK